MAEFRLTINLDNDAFQPDPVPEIVQILRRWADRTALYGLPELGASPRIIDENGNACGTVTIA